MLRYHYLRIFDWGHIFTRLEHLHLFGRFLLVCFSVSYRQPYRFERWFFYFHRLCAHDFGPLQQATFGDLLRWLWEQLAGFLVHHAPSLVLWSLVLRLGILPIGLLCYHHVWGLLWSHCWQPDHRQLYLLFKWFAFILLFASRGLNKDGPRSLSVTISLIQYLAAIHWRGRLTSHHNGCFLFLSLTALQALDLAQRREFILGHKEITVQVQSILGLKQLRLLLHRLHAEWLDRDRLDLSLTLFLKLPGAQSSHTGWLQYLGLLGK